MLKLTPRQAEILAFIKRCLEDNGYPPTRAEIAQELGFKSPNAAEEHLKALARISRLLRNNGICDKLRGTDSAEALFAILTESQEDRAA